MPHKDPLKAIDAYRDSLEGLYEGWVDSFVKAASKEEKEDDFKLLVDIAILMLLADMIEQGRKKIPESIGLAGITQGQMPDTLRGFLVNAVDRNDDYLSKSLVPDLRRALHPVAGMRFEPEELRKVMLKFKGRISSYAGAYWEVYNRAVGAKTGKNKITWRLDPQAQHCDTCLLYGDREYPSFDDMINFTGGIWPAHNTICRHSDRCILMPG